MARYRVWEEAADGSLVTFPLVRRRRDAAALALSRAVAPIFERERALGTADYFDARLRTAAALRPSTVRCSAPLPHGGALRFEKEE